MSEEEDQAPAPDFEVSTLPSVATMMAALAAGRAAQRSAGAAMVRRFDKMPAINELPGTPLENLAAFTRREVDDLTEFAAKKGVRTPIVAGGARGNAAFFPGMPRVADVMGPEEARRAADKLGLPLGIGKEQIVTRVGSVPVVMHEIGHAAPILGSTRLRNAWQGLGAGVRLVGGPARAALMANAITSEQEGESDVRGFARDNAAALVGATSAPQLLEEARATGNALAGARRYGPGVGRTARELLPAYGTYALAAAVPVIATLAAQKVMEYMRSRALAGEKVAAAPTKEVQSPGILRASASAAWRTGASAPKPKTTRPSSSPVSRAKDHPQAKPPSKAAYFADVIKSLNNPQRGFRGAKPG